MLRLRLWASRLKRSCQLQLTQNLAVDALEQVFFGGKVVVEALGADAQFGSQFADAQAVEPVAVQRIQSLTSDFLGAQQGGAGRRTCHVH